MFLKMSWTGVDEENRRGLGRTLTIKLPSKSRIVWLVKRPNFLISIVKLEESVDAVVGWRCKEIKRVNVEGV